jgi:arylsulfatase A-like enzyme
LFNHMADSGRLDDTLVIFTADHGDFLGDHWLGEKELFYDTVQKVPFIVADPRPQADISRGTVDTRFVEAVDVVPTVLDTLGLLEPAGASHRIEGRSLKPLLEGGTPPWRDFVYAELDYSFRHARQLLGQSVAQARAFSIRDARWRYVYWLAAPEQLYDLAADPDEMHDLGRDPGHASVRAVLRDRLLQFLAQRKHRTTVSESFIESRTNRHKQAGVFYGQW